MSSPDSTTAQNASSEGTRTSVSTPLSAALAAQGSTHELALHCGAWTPRVFDEVAKEVHALLHSAGVSDLGWRGKILVTGGDRLRWLNGMVSNAVQSLPEKQGNYSFLLSVQGRIQGDCYVYRRADDLLLDSGYDQIPGLMRHLDHYIIMDDVELADVSRQWTAITLTGPKARNVLETLGFDVLGFDALGFDATSTALGSNVRMSGARIGEVACTIVESYHVAVPRYELWFPPQQALAVWETLQAAGAVPCGLEAMEALRVLEAVPLYGVDLNDRDLPQETGQTRALNFSKGCYLGQEIVERIRSRGKVNRQFRQFVLQGDQPAALPADLRSAEQSVGHLTSFASLATAGQPKLLALGFIRVEAVRAEAIRAKAIQTEATDRNDPQNGAITYDGGVATALTAPPQIAGPAASSR